MTIGPKTQAALDVIKASPQALTAAQVAARTKHPVAATKFIMASLTKAELIHVVGKKKVYGGLPNLYAFGPEPKIMTVADRMNDWTRIAKEKLEARA